jgi:hypothetical protein
MSFLDLRCDVLIAGGGMSGVCAALSSARHGSRVILVQDRSRLGGNSSSEIGMHIVGANNHGARPNWRESGLIEELRLEDAVHNPHRAFELWDLLLYDKCVSEPNISLLLDSTLFAATVEDGNIKHVVVRCDKTEQMYRIKASIFCDCTGDSRLALEAGADFRIGRESREEFEESLAPPQADRQTQGSTILFTARKHDVPMPYSAPSWARKMQERNFRFRPITSWEYGYWWIELGGTGNTIRDNERLRFELLRVVLGTWDYIKNSGEFPDSAKWALQTVGMVPGKRESRRVMGDVIHTQPILEGGWKELHDGVAIGGWNLDDHPPEGFDAPDKPPFTSIPLPEPYNISLGALYSRNIENLMVAGRNISNSHIAFSSTRVMATCSCIGQAVGTAVALCLQQGVMPVELRRNRKLVQTLQQVLLRDDQTIRMVRNQDSDDLALKASVTASGSIPGAEPRNVLTGKARDADGSNQNRWVEPLKEGKPAWIELSWQNPQEVGYVQLTFDTGFQRELTLSSSDEVSSRIVRAPQPETIRDYRIMGVTAGETKNLVAVTGNYQRLRRHEFEPVRLSRLRIEVLGSNGSDEARLYEIRCYRKKPVL